MWESWSILEGERWQVFILQTLQKAVNQGANHREAMVCSFSFANTSILSIGIHPSG